MCETKTGALIVITQIDDLAVFSESGVLLNAEISTSIFESIFLKNSPLHDGALIIRNNQIISARCVLPVTNSTDFPQNLGMRHRAAVGITEESDAIAMVVSEENGKFLILKMESYSQKRTPIQLEQFLARIFTKK